MITEQLGAQISAGHGDLYPAIVRRNHRFEMIVVPVMTPEQRRRAGGAVAARIRELGMTVPGFARKVGLDPSTVRRVIAGTRWPREDTRVRLAEGLGWQVGEFARRANASERVPEVRQMPTLAMLNELCRRARAGTL